MRLRHLRTQPEDAVELLDGVLELELEGSAAEVEILEAALLIRAETAPRVETLGPNSEGIALASSAGEGIDALKQQVSWVSIVWSARRSLEALTLCCRGAAERVLLKIADTGPWYPPDHPPLCINVDRQALPPVVATGALLSFIVGDKETPSVTLIESLSFDLGRRPLDLSVVVGDEPTLAHHAAFAPGESWRVDTGLREALRRTLARARTARITLRSSSPAHLANLELRLKTQRIIRAWAGGSQQRVLPLCAGDESITRLRLPPAEAIDRLSLRTSWSSAFELAPPLPKQIDVRHGQRLQPRSTYAQKIDDEPSRAPIIGLDLHLRPLAKTIRGKLWIVHERDGRPAEPHGLPLASLEIDAPERGQARSTWFAVDLPAPFESPESSLWIVVKIDEGELIWTLSGRPPRSPGTNVGALYRRGAETWSPRRHLGADRPGEAVNALHRLRRAATKPAAKPALSIRRVGGGPESEHILRITDDGALGISPEALAELNEARQSLLELVARADYAGTLRLFDLQIALAPADQLLTPTEGS